MYLTDNSVDDRVDHSPASPAKTPAPEAATPPRVLDGTVLFLLALFTAPVIIINLVDDALNEDHTALATRIAEDTPLDVPVSDGKVFFIVIPFIVRTTMMIVIVDSGDEATKTLTAPLAAPEVAIARPEAAVRPTSNGNFSLLHVNKYCK